MAKKAVESGVSHAGDKVGKKFAEKSGDLIMKRLSKMRSNSAPTKNHPWGHKLFSRDEWRQR